MNQKDWGFQWTFERKYLPRCEFLCIFVEKIYLLREDLSVFSEKIYPSSPRRLICLLRGDWELCQKASAVSLITIFLILAVLICRKFHYIRFRITQIVLPAYAMKHWGAGKNANGACTFPQNRQRTIILTLPRTKFGPRDVKVRSSGRQGSVVGTTRLGPRDDRNELSGGHGYDNSSYSNFRIFLFALSITSVSREAR